MDEIVGEDFRKEFQDPSSLFPVYWAQKGEEKLVEEASGGMDCIWDTSFSLGLLVPELPSCGQEERDSCKHV